MLKVAISGGSSDIGLSVSNELCQRSVDTSIYSRNVLGVKFHENAKIKQVEDYTDLTFDGSTNRLLICNGEFIFGNFDSLSSSEVSRLLDANYLSLVQIIQSFIKQTSSAKRRTVFVLGSTASYDLGPLTNVYASVKSGIKNLLTALNREYVDHDLRFSYIGLSTVNNLMGRRVPDQIESTLLNSDQVGRLVADLIVSDSNYFIPEIVIRRRMIQNHLK